jgi:hypothetical protein
MHSEKQEHPSSGVQEADADFPILSEEERRDFIRRVRKKLPELDRALEENIRQLRRIAAGLPPD